MPLDLTQPQQPNTPDAIAASLKHQAKMVYNNMLNTFNRGARMFWSNPNATPEQIATALGTDAKELFELHAKLGQLLSSINTASVVEVSSVVGNFTYEEDGRVTVLNQPQ